MISSELFIEGQGLWSEFDDPQGDRNRHWPKQAFCFVGFRRLVILDEGQINADSNSIQKNHIYNSKCQAQDILTPGGGGGGVL